MIHQEMRKQVELLQGAIVLTAQERPEGVRQAFREDLFKKFASADGIFGRMPYQILTKVHRDIRYSSSNDSSVPVGSGW